MFGNSKQAIEKLESRIDFLERKLASQLEAHDEAFALLRQQLAAIARGEQLDPGAIEDGAPFASIAASDAADYFAAHPECLVVDVRTDDEWNQGHISGAKHLDVQEIESRYTELPTDKSAPIACICAMGGRSSAACEFLANQGYTRLTNIDGGMNGYTGETVTE